LVNPLEQLRIGTAKEDCMFNINHQVGIKASAEKIYEALTTNQGLATWWTNDTSGAGDVGATIAFRFNGGGPDFTVSELVPNQTVKCPKRGWAPAFCLNCAKKPIKPLCGLPTPIGRNNLTSWAIAVPNGLYFYLALKMQWKQVKAKPFRMTFTLITLSTLN
jgi:hypothetical protein